MGGAIAVRTDYTSGELRGVAKGVDCGVGQWGVMTAEHERVARAPSSSMPACAT